MAAHWKQPSRASSNRTTELTKLGSQGPLTCSKTQSYRGPQLPDSSLGTWPEVFLHNKVAVRPPRQSQDLALSLDLGRFLAMGLLTWKEGRLDSSKIF